MEKSMETYYGSDWQSDLALAGAIPEEAEPAVKPGSARTEEVPPAGASDGAAGTTPPGARAPDAPMTPTRQSANPGSGDS